MVVRVEQLQELWGDPLGGIQPAPGLINAVSTDSRAALEGALFVPLVGERLDGHCFLPEVLTRAAGAIAQADRIDASALQQLAERHRCPLWIVPDSLQAYQDLARLWRRNLGPRWWR